MSEYSRRSRTPAKKRPSSKPAGKSFGPSRPRTSASPGGRRPANTSKKKVSAFDPSLFMKQVAELRPTPVYVPQHMFSDFPLEERLITNIAERGYHTPTPIQDQVIPLLLEGRDVIASANTGTGKTAAFLIPLINNMYTQKTERVLIIAPTRELADQINNELRIFARNSGITSTLCIGGASTYAQIKELKKHPDFVIGTPGRLMDLEENEHLSFSSFTSIVLDEVDVMLDMGFINAITHILARLPKRRHSLFFSATMPPKLKQLMQSFLHNPATISVQTRQSAENVNQEVIRAKPHEKIEVLHDLLIKPALKKVIIFARTKRSTDRLSKELRLRGFNIATLHGDKTQEQRKKALTQFKNNSVTILLATDVVARGIDIDDVTHVINYDLPQTHEDYIHRIGRTGRAQKIGYAITFIE